MNMMNGSGGNAFITFASIALIFVVLYFINIKPQKKKERARQEMLNSLQIGYIVTTIGGIVGIIISIKEDGIIIETGNDRNKVRIKKWAIKDVETSSSEQTENTAKSNSEQKS